MGVVTKKAADFIKKQAEDAARSQLQKRDPEVVLDRQK